MTKLDNQFQQTARSSRVCTVCLTQNILNLAEELGEDHPGARTKAFLGNLRLKIFHQQNEPDTNHYAAELFSRHYISHATVDSNGGAQVSEDYRWIVEPGLFSSLHMPTAREAYAEAVVYQGGGRFHASGTNHLIVPIPLIL